MKTEKPTKIVLSSLKADSKIEAAGEWKEAVEWPGVAFKLRSIEYGPYRIARDQLAQKLFRQYKRKSIPQEVAAKEFGKLYAQYLLIDWRGLDVSYSPERAEEVLCDPEYRKIVRVIEYLAGEVGEQDIQFTEETAKN